MKDNIWTNEWVVQDKQLLPLRHVSLSTEYKEAYYLPRFFSIKILVIFNSEMTACMHKRASL